jgi:membrane associated rhomboid family serine protease
MLLLLVGLLHGADVPLVGASAGIFGVLVAGAILAPDVTIMFIFPPVPIQLKYLALILVGWAAYTALSGGYNAGGQAAHIGGAALGYLLIRHPHVLNFVEPRSQRSLRLRRRSRSTDWSKNFDR